MQDILAIVSDILGQSWLVLGEMGPYLLLGFVVAGLLSVFVSPEWLERHLGGRGLGPIVKASIFGVPLPLCSCGVLPVAASLRRHGASRPATASFLLSTPQTGVDSILVTHAVLGPLFAVYRPVVALVTGIVGGLLVRLLGESDRPAERTAVAPNCSGSAGGGCAGGCGLPEHGQGNRLGRALRYGLVTLPRDIGLALLAGVLIAGAISALVPPDSLGAYLGGGIVSLLIMMAIGIPIYVCATASVPIAAGLIHMGASPGAALAFLIAGPATNAAAVTTLWHVMGKRTAMVYLGSAAAAALGFGLLLDALGPAVSGLLPHPSSHVHGMGGGGWQGHLFAVILLLVLAVSFRLGRRDEAVGDRPSLGAGVGAGAGDSAGDRIYAGGGGGPGGGDLANAETGGAGTGTTPAGRSSRSVADGAKARGRGGNGQYLELQVEGMTCSHCVGAVRRAVTETRGVEAAEVSLARSRVVVRGASVEVEELIAAIDSLGYRASLAPVAGPTRSDRRS